jgi:hypothetical protein
MRFRIPLVLALAGTALAISASPASAMVVGVESNHELVNSNVTLEQRTRVLDEMRAAGAKAIRVNLGWNEFADACGSQPADALRDDANPCYSWSGLDQTVSLASARGIQVVASVSRAPEWLHGARNPMWLGTTAQQWARTVSFYSSFMQAAAHRYRAGSAIGQVRMWTVWNEPNSNTFLAPQLSTAQKRVVPARYAQLLGRTAVAIKAGNPRALVAAGPTGPTGGGQFGVKPIPFIAAVQRNLPRFLPGATLAAKRRWIDAWAHNPYPSTRRSPSLDNAKSPVVRMNNLGDLFRQLDRSPYTRGKPVWATEFGWETNPPDRIFGTAPATQARFMGEAFDWLDRSRRVTVAIWYQFRDASSLGDWQSGVLYANGRRKPSYYWLQRAVSVNAATVRRGRFVRVYVRSGVRPGAVRIAMSTNGGRSWRLLGLRGRRSDGSMVQNVRVTARTTMFAAYDGTRGPSRVVRGVG